MGSPCPIFWAFLHGQVLFNFFFFWEQRLRFLLKKELKNSDVGSLGRIVLPKVMCSLSLSICAQVFFLFFYFYYSIITVSGKGI